MSTTKLLRFALLPLAVVLLASLLPSCGSRPAGGLQDAELAELDSLPAPEGVDAATWSQLKSALASALAARTSSTPPSGDNAVAPLDYDTGTATLSWGYYAPGDYNQDSQVGISDLTPLAAHFGESAGVGGFQPDSIQAVIDGDRNGVIGLADITPIAAHFGERVEGYRAYRGASSDYPSAPDTPNGPGATLVDSIPLDLSASPSVGRRQLSLAIAPVGGTYWVRPFDGALDGAASDSVAVDDPNSGPVPVLRADPPRGGAPLSVSLEATGSSDADGMVVLYEWDFDGSANGEQWFSSGQDPVVVHVYDAMARYNPLVRVTDDQGKVGYAGVEVVVDDGVNDPPVAQLAASPPAGVTPFGVVLEAAGSRDGDGEIVRYEWDLDGDGAYELDSGALPAMPTVYYGAGSYPVALRVTDNLGSTDIATLTLGVSKAAKWRVRNFDKTNDVVPACSIAESNGVPVVGYYFRTDENDLSAARDAVRVASDALGTAWNDVEIIPPSPTASLPIPATYIRRFELVNRGGNPTLLLDHFLVSESGHDYANGFYLVQAQDPLGSTWPDLDSTVQAIFDYPELGIEPSYPARFPNYAMIGDRLAVSLGVTGGWSFHGLTVGRTYFNIATDTTAAAWGAQVEITAISGESSLAQIAGMPAVAGCNEGQGDLLYDSAVDADGTGWRGPKIVDGAGNVGSFPVLLDAGGLPAIVYADRGLELLKYVRALDTEGRAWSHPRVLAMQAGGLQKALLLNGRLVVLYTTRDGAELHMLAAYDPAGLSWQPPLTVYHCDAEQGVYIPAYSTNRSLDFEIVGGKLATVFYANNLLAPAPPAAGILYGMYY